MDTKLPWQEELDEAPPMYNLDVSKTVEELGERIVEFTRIDRCAWCRVSINTVELGDDGLLHCLICEKPIKFKLARRLLFWYVSQDRVLVDIDPVQAMNNRMAKALRNPAEYLKVNDK